ncbi:hypothetical protein [Undibacterium sp. TC9W]|uniref:hypothetical protein n=1 Tax=Undibacterium sp. TC9W TaxID=3413053 RepID=UPI003BF1BC03
MTGSKLNVLLLDDDTDRAQAWAKKINEITGCAANAPDKKGVLDIISILFQRRRMGRAQGDAFWDIECPTLDGADLLIIDYDLQNLDDNGEWTTGSEIAYAVRLVSKAKEVIVINQRGANRFDLTMVKAADSRADLDIGGVQLTNPGLWQSSAFNGYRPWHWPNLIQEPQRVEQSVTFVAKNLDIPILKCLGFSDDFESGCALRPEVWGKLCANQATTFRQLVVAAREEDSIHVLFADVPIFKENDHLIASIAASITRRWLEKWVLPNQDILCDVPHLALKYPWIIKEYDNEASWHALETLDQPSNLIDRICEFQFRPLCLFSKPVFWGEKIDVCGQELLPQDFDYSAVPQLVFREDVSNFGSPDDSRDYPSQVLSIDNRRWVTEPEKQQVNEGPADVRAVVFEPQSLLLS